MSSEAAAAKKRGNAHFAKKEWDKAIEEYTKAIELNANDHTYYSNRSACYASKNDFQNALNDGLKCIELNSKWPKGYSRVGYALFKLNKLDEAKKTYEQGLKIDPNNGSLKSGLKEVEMAQSGGGAGGGGGLGNLFGPQMWQMIAQDPELRQYLNDPDFKQKIQMLQSNPQMAMQMGLLGDPKIKKVFEKMLGMSFGTKEDQGNNNDNNNNNNKPDEMPSNPYDKFRTSATSDNKKKEEKEKEKEKEKSPSPQLTEEEKKEREEQRLKEEEALKHKNNGNELYKAKKFNEAIVEYKKAQEINPKQASFILNESAALFMMEKWDECIECCNRAIKCCRENFCDLVWTYKAFHRMGNVEEKRKNWKEAIKYYNTALVEKKDPKLRKRVKDIENFLKKQEKKALFNPELAEQLKAEGNELFKKGDFNGAIEKYSEAIQRNPKDHKLYSNRATAFCKVMRWDAAMDDCKKAIKLEPSFQKAYIRKGKIHHCLKDYHKALEAFAEAEKIDPNVEDLITSKRDTMYAIQQRNQGGQMDEQARQRAMQDPAVQAAINDPEVSSVLLQAQSGDPTILTKAMRDRPHIAKKIQTLIAAGILRVG